MDELPHTSPGSRGPADTTSLQPVHVCAAVIERDGLLLLAQRAVGSHLAGQWEFPGGKVRGGESYQSCIRREIREEMGVDVAEPEHLHSLTHTYPEKTVHLHFLWCSIAAQAQPRALEHERIAWVTPTAAAQLNMAEADRRFLNWLALHCLRP